MPTAARQGAWAAQASVLNLRKFPQFLVLGVSNFMSPKKTLLNNIKNNEGGLLNDPVSSSS